MKRRGSIGLLLLTAMGTMAAASGHPALPHDRAGWDLLPQEGLDPRVWHPMQGSDPVTAVNAGKRHGLHMPCRFEQREVVRAAWDWAVPLDLTRCQGIQFQFQCPNQEPVAYFSAHLKSGKGWYSFTFAPDHEGWNRIELKKTAATREGTPEGWGQIDTLRISAWRGGDTDTEFFLADLGFLGTDAPIAIVQNDALPAGHPEHRNVETATEFLAQSLDELGIGYARISDADVLPERLQGKTLVILPYAPALPGMAVDHLAAFVKNGGKVLSFYTVYPALAAAMGFKPGRYLGKNDGIALSALRASDSPLPAQPQLVQQHSWNIQIVTPVTAHARVAAEWLNDTGEPTGYPAVVASDSGVHMTHLLLSDDPANKRRLLLAMVGHLCPHVLRQCAETALARAEGVPRLGDFRHTRKSLLHNAPRNERVRRNLAQAAVRRHEARHLLEQEHFAEVFPIAEEIRAHIREAFCAAQKSVPGEHRAYWCHSAFGVNGMTWDEAIKILADNGFTAILPNMLWGGSAFYPSKVLPVAPQVAEKGDQIALCLAACKKYGVACHIWKVNWNMGWSAPQSFLDAMREQNRTQVAFDGTPQPAWLCPSHPDNQQLEIDAMVEVATQYDVDGIHFDYIRYPDSDHCFCPGCRRRFEQRIGRPIVNWPQDIRADKALERQWNDFRRDQITAVVAAVHDRVRAFKPHLRLSAAVFSNWVRDRDSVAQDWKRWCEQGYLDFVCPMDYTPMDAHFDSMVRKQMDWASGVPCYPGIGQSVWPEPTDLVTFADQVKITRKYKTGGFTVFNYGTVEARETVPLCGLGLTAK